MPISIVVDGKVLDYHYKKRADEGYNFYIGDILIGFVFGMKYGWSAVSWKKPCKYGLIGGFKTRYDASKFLLKVCGYIKN